MIDPWEIIGRGEEGPHIPEKEFDMNLFKKLASLEKEYEIKFNGEPLLQDKQMINSIYEAGLELAVETGFYLLDTQRRILFTEDEIKYYLSKSKKKLVLGEGKEAEELVKREINDKKPPLLIAGMAGTPLPERDFFIKSAMSYVKEEVVKGLDHGSITSVEGREVRTGSPLEIHATRREITWLREALQRVGRPGLHLLDGESSITSKGVLSVLSPNYLRKTDAYFVPVLNEMKTDYVRLSKALAGTEYGCLIASLVDPILGGYSRGPEGTAICSIAELILSKIIYQANYFLLHPSDIRVKSTTTPQCTWVLGAVGQAISKNTDLLVFADVWVTSGAGTETVFQEIVPNTLVATYSSLHLLGPVTACGLLPNGTGLEARYMGEIAETTAKKQLKPEIINEVASRYLNLYINKLSSPDLGISFKGLYNMEKVTPRKKYLNTFVANFEKFKKEIGIHD